MDNNRTDRVTAEHAAYVIANIRPQDRAELEAARGRPYQETVRQGVNAIGSYALTVGNEVLAIYGVNPVCPLSDDKGVIWCIGSTAVDRYRKIFLAESVRFVKTSQNTYGYLYNYVDARYTQSIRWLKWLGFQIYPPAPYGELGKPFHKFDWGAEHV